MSFVNLGGNFWMVSRPSKNWMGDPLGGSHKGFVGYKWKIGKLPTLFDLNFLIIISRNAQKKPQWGKCFDTFHNNKYPLCNEEGNMERNTFTFVVSQISKSLIKQ